MVYYGKIESAAALTPHDTNANEYDGIRNGAAAGDIKVRFENGVDHVFKAVPSGAIIPCKINRVYSTGTTATVVEGIKLE
jgi:hypothetical protein